MVDLQQIGELRAMAGRMAGLQTTIHGWGEPSRLAGDPGALRGQAGTHRAAASDLRAALDQGRGRATTVTAGSWQGSASVSFAGFWARVDGQVEGLASRHVEMAGALDDIAGRAETLNQQVTDVVGSIEGWLSAAATAVAKLDVPAVPALVGRGAAILAQWESLFAELEAFASSLPDRINVDLGVTLPTPWPTPIDGRGPVDVPLPGLPGILITSPGPKGPGILITTPGQSPAPPDVLPPGLTGIPGLGRNTVNEQEEPEPEPTPPSEEPSPPSDEPPTLPKPPWAPPDSEWRGPGPEGSSQGGWFDPETGTSIHPHPDSPHHDPHYDVSQRGEPGYTRVYPDGQPDEVVP